LTDQNKSDLNDSLESLKKAYSEKEIEEIETSMEQLNQTWNCISTELYSQTQTSEEESTTR
jgi:molecular chaperone DnaK